MWRHSRPHAPAGGAALGALAPLAARLSARAAPRVPVEAAIMEDESSWHR
jgi:hypothetical protein